MGLSRTVSEKFSNFSRKWQKIFIPVYFAPMLTGFPLELGIRARGQTTRVMGLPDGLKSFKIGLVV